MNIAIVEATHDENQVRKYYGWRASNYDAGTRFEVEHHLEAVRLAEIKPGQRVLDAACGTGRATIELAKAVGPTGRVDALDLTEAMLQQARSKVSKSALTNVSFMRGTVRELPYPDQSFDLVYNGYMFDLIPRDGFTPVLGEFKRVLKPEGKLVLVNMSKPDNRMTFFEKVYHKGLAVAPCRPVLMTPYLEQAGFEKLQRLYRPTRGFTLARLWGTEIVLAQKAASRPVAI